MSKMMGFLEQRLGTSPGNTYDFSDAQIQVSSAARRPSPIISWFSFTHRNINPGEQL